MLGLGFKIMEILEHIKKLSRILNSGRLKQDYRYYIVVQSDVIGMILVKSNKNLISEVGYFHNEVDCKMIIDKYKKGLIDYFKEFKSPK